MRVGLIMRSALPEDLEHQRLGTKDMADVTVSRDAIRISILNMLKNMIKDTIPTHKVSEPDPNNVTNLRGL